MLRRRFKSTLVGAVALAALAPLASTHVAQGSDRFGPRLAGAPLEVIDMHLHPGRFEDMGPIGQAYLRRTLPGILPESFKNWSLSLVAKVLFNPYGLFWGIQSECKQAQVSLCGLMALYAPETWGVTTNQQLMRWLDDPRNRGPGQGPQFFGLASVDTRDWPDAQEAALADLRQALAHPLVRGIKLAFIHNKTPLDDPRYDAIYEVAREFGVPVYHHVGSSPLRRLEDFSDGEDRQQYLASYDPARLRRVIRAYPEVPFIMGHVGFDFNQEGMDFGPEVYALAAEFPNVFLEISAFGYVQTDPDGRRMDLVLRTLKSKRLIDRTLYGSDGPTSPGGSKAYLQATLQSMARVGYDAAEAQQVLAGTARRLFRL